MKKVFIGIDPGEKGGIAVLDKGSNVLDIVKMPVTPQDILQYISEWKDNDEYVVHCALEDVGKGMPGQSSVATAKLARHCGHLEMVLLAKEVKTVYVTPKKWQKEYQLGSSKGYTKTQWKNKLKAKAQQLFPELGKKVTLAVSDALLIAEYCKRLNVST